MDRLATAMQASPEEEALRRMSPTQALRMAMELGNKREVGPEQAAANRQQNLRDFLSIIPGPGNVIAAEDAVTQGVEAATQFGQGNYGRGALAAALGGLSGFGAVTGLPTGRMAGNAAKGASSRTNMFAGPMAKTADHAALAKAQEMAGAGANRDDIWRDTGWMQGVDGKWRFEIDDSASAVHNQLWNQTGAGTLVGAPLDRSLSHDELYRAYPDLRRHGPNVEMSVNKYSKTGGKAAYYPNANLIKATEIPDRDAARSILLHEIQHPIQGREGFARGATAAEYARGPMFDKKATDLQGDLSKALTGGLASKAPEIKQIIKYGDPQELGKIAEKHGFSSIDDAMAFLMREDDLRTPFSQYQRTAGEVEARNVQTRMNMTAAERRAKAPWHTQDVPDNQQIVRK